VERYDHMLECDGAHKLVMYIETVNNGVAENRIRPPPVTRSVYPDMLSVDSTRVTHVRKILDALRLVLNIQIYVIY
jgi:hypothetical protein